MTSTPLAELTTIVIAGIRNAGKSSLMNNLFKKNVAIVSDIPGTTTDPVTRKIELGKLGMCAVTDTAGLDDTGVLGDLRVQKSKERLIAADLLLFASPVNLAPLPQEQAFLGWLKARKIPWIGVATFSDQLPHPDKTGFFPGNLFISQDNFNPESALKLVERMEQLHQKINREITPVEGLVKEQDLVLLVTPIDLSAPAGRLILPQVETIRDLLDRDCAALIVKERELSYFYKALTIRPSLVITDSQAFHKVAADLPEDQALTSFSLLFARKKGDPAYFIKSLKALKNFPETGRVLVMEACSHHCQAEDLGRVKIPRLFRQMVGSRVEFVHSRQAPEHPKEWDLIIHCGGCMLTQKAMEARLAVFRENRVPVLNYGLFLAWAHGLLPRALEPFFGLADLYTRSG
ncbi:MAG: [FeFe] hydrogenase H-cluster maturation GTPase HydF [Proteobacteria bacterium]|nr:[FeFe] hydrogenase H-cluster maturation GTPase HydF [Desulfobacula sp.]MBU4130562.1 [FeFe] hydrogenase H-cluster maturation GTPase HydF [Pseudomonadota bacterium]